MKVVQYGRWVLAVVLPLATGATHAATSLTDGKYTFAAPGVVEPSWPLFQDNNETLRVEKKGSGANTYWRVTGTGTTTSFWGGVDNSVNLGGERVKYQANFNSEGRLITSIGNKTLRNYLEIRGSLPAGTFGGTSWESQRNQTLLTATLLDVNPGNNKPDSVGIDNGSALGFNTKFTGGWVANNPGLTGGSTGESLWLFASNPGFQKLVDALDSSDGNNGTFSTLFRSSFKTITNVSSVAAVPLPGAVWMFAAGLLGLAGGRKRARQGSLVG